MISQRKSKKTLPYFTNSDGKYECCFCGHLSNKQPNACKHFKKYHFIKEQDLSSFTYKGKPISKFTEKILIWKCSHGIPMAALNDSYLSDLLPPSTLKSAKTNQKILDEMCNQIININYSKTQGKTISLILDGGTVNHTKWLAIGFLHRTLELIKFQVLDVKVFEKTTASDIKYEIELIADKVFKEYKGKIVAACTDNAANFKKVFLKDNIPEYELTADDFIPLNMIRVSCSCHTMQLALKDLKKEDPYYRKLIKKMKTIPSKISFLTRKEIQKLRITSFPPLQKQRWNSIFITLSYIILNVGSISSLFDSNEIECFNMFELIQLQNELRPIYDFTVKCESNNFNQADVYLEFRALECKLEILNTKRSKKLLTLIRKRFSTTADIELSKLCYFTTNAGINEKRNRYPHINLSTIDTSNEESTKQFDEELKFIKSFETTIKKVCSKIDVNSEAVLTAFEIMMNHHKPPNDDIHRFPSSIELQRIISNYSSNEKCYIHLAKFINILQVLPSSEAGAERIFARMRDVYHKKQTRLSPKSLRSNLIVSFYVEQENPNETNGDCFLKEEEDEDDDDDEEEEEEERDNDEDDSK